MKTIYYTASSLDGFLATEDDSLAWLFALGTSLEGENGSDSGDAAFIAGIGALAMGSATYEWLLRNPERVAAETGSPWPSRHRPATPACSTARSTASAAIGSMLSAFHSPSANGSTLSLEVQGPCRLVV
jgi:hypothetical protein